MDIDSPKRPARLAVGLDLARWTPPALLGLFALALAAFWPGYLRSPSSLGTPYTHLHAISATIWFVLLIVQPYLIRVRRRPLHRTIGYASVVVALVAIVGMLLGAHGRVTDLVTRSWEIGRFLLYLQVTLAVAFAVCWSLGMLYRKDRTVHQRFMIGTAIAFVDPVLARLLPSMPDLPRVAPHFITFGVAIAIILGLMWSERHAKKGRWAFGVVLGIFLLLALPLWLGVTETSAWEAFTRWYLALPLT